MDDIQNISVSNVDLSLAEILASLSYALDLTSGQPMGHAQRTCLVAMRIGYELGLSGDLMSSLYHATLLKDSGCSSNSARMYEIFGGDEIAVKRASKVVDWSNLLEAAMYAATYSLPGSSFIKRAAHFAGIAPKLSEMSNALMDSRCTRGAQIVKFIGLGDDAAECIRALDEHWDGCGAPNHLKGDQIPILGRIACLSQTLEVFVATFERAEAYRMAAKRKGKWFDPELVRIAESFADDDLFWSEVRDNPRGALMAIEVDAAVAIATEQRIDSICSAFAAIVDAKSPFTGEHSIRVRDYTVQIAEAFGIRGRRLTSLRRASLLHDIGKLAVPNIILDKPGKPTEEEWVAIRKHPHYSHKILSQIRGFERLAELAAAHHERLDGTGYFQGLTADQLDLDMRIIAVADVFDALSAERPYRSALPRDDVFRILERESGAALDRRCIAMLKDRYGGSSLADMRTKPELVAA